MADRALHPCQCPACVPVGAQPDREHHRQLNLLMSRLDEQQRRWLAALESKKLGHGGDTLVALITGLHIDTIRRGREELDDDLRGRPTDRVRQPGAGRPPVKKKTPDRRRPQGAGRAGDWRRPHERGEVCPPQLADPQR